MAGTVDEYVERAMSLARAPKTLGHLTELRQGMREHLACASICNPAAFARNMEGLYAGMLGQKSIGA